jgi:pimeloyl-ACP methyl ester carboxylesterase
MTLFHAEGTLRDDQKHTKAAIDAMGGPVVLVGHRYGRSIISEAGNHPNVAALVYIAAFALDEGASPNRAAGTAFPAASFERRLAATSVITALFFYRCRIATRDVR